jgi:hypothetical protein
MGRRSTEAGVEDPPSHERLRCHRIWGEFPEARGLLSIPARGGINPARNRFARAIIGAGTGLGKSILIHDQGLDLYLPHPSEGEC